MNAAAATIGENAAHGVDRLSAMVLGQEKYDRMQETVGAMGTIARYITGANSTEEEEDDYEYIDYSQYHRSSYDYDGYYDHYHDHYSEPAEMVYQETGDLYYDLPYEGQPTGYAETQVRASQLV